MTPAQKQIDESTYSGRFAARLRMLREKAGLTGQQMAEVVTANGFAIAQRTYYAWESGRNDPPLNAYPSLAKSLNLKRIRDLIPAE